jgi:L-threonylcarbamoyladenylate synthase
VAIRMPSHPVASALIALSGLPLAAPSANTSGRPSPTRAIHVKNDLGGRVQLILDGGECDVGVESTVVDGLGEDGHIRVLRPGGVTVEDLKRVLEKVLTRGTGSEPIKVLVHRKDYVDEEMEKQPTTPGMKYRHYSPTCPVYLLMNTLETDSRAELLTSADTLLEETVTSLLDGTQRGDGMDKIQIGLLSLTDSALTRTLLKKTSIAYAATALQPQPQVTQIEWVTQELGKMVHKDGAEGNYDTAEPARRLFDGLISLDGKGVDVIFVEGVREEREGLAVMNRVRKAAGRVCWLRVDAD